jgi:hypothetical protein
MTADNTVALRSGLRMKSQVCATEVIVIRPGAGTARLCCGGVPMVERDAEIAAGAVAVPGRLRGSVLGKRYTSPDDETLELLVTAAGEGTLGDGDADLVPKTAKPLPASD